MSIQAVGWVLDWSPTKGTDRLVLISIANHAGTAPRDGAWEAYPSVQTIAHEAGISKLDTVRDAINRLIDAGHLERVLNGAPDHRIRRDRRPNLYRIVTVPDPVSPAPVDSHSNDLPPRGGSSNPRPPAPGVNDPPPQGSTTPRPRGAKPSVEPSLNQPPQPPPVENPPAVDPSRVVVNDQQQPPEQATTGDARRARIHDACLVMAARLAERTPGIAYRERWIDRVAARLETEHAANGHRHLMDHPDMPPAVLADLLDDHPPSELSPEQQRARQRQREQDTQRRIRDTLAARADQPPSNPVPDIRAALRRPQETPTDA